jgi:predicted phosphodiesterase
VLTLLLVGVLSGACGGAEPSDTTRSTDRSVPTSTMESAPSTTTSTVPTATTTSNPHVEEPADLLVVGDWGSGTLPQGAVAGAMHRYAEDHDVAAILTTGDNFYSDDWEFLIEPYGWASESDIPFWIVWGNHDVESRSRLAAVNHAFDDPPRWAIHEWGQVDIVILDSTQITSPQQALFFLDAMGDSHDPTIVAMHHPPYSCAHNRSTTDLVDQVVEILDDDVFLVLSGHEHVYQRFERDGVAYVVTGGGGASTYELSACPANHPEPLAGESTHHFLALHGTKEAIELSAIDVNGEPLDQVEILLP